MNKVWLTLVFICGALSLQAQLLPDRYREEVFNDYVETEEVLFSTNVPQPEPGGGFYEWLTDYPLNVDEYQTNNINLYMDVFEPSGDTITKRPLVIICFGGGFLAGSKDHWSMRLIAQKLALRGYVTATIDYRLGMNIFDADLSMRAPYRGVQDGRSAIRYFKADAAGDNTYRIDTSNIYIGGHSAGAFIALHNAYMNKESERPASTYVWSQDGNVVADQLCLDCVGNNQAFSGHASAVFSLAGALGYTDYIESDEDPTVVMFHSEDDDTVPYNSGQPFSSLLWLVVGSDLPDVYGSAEIADRCDEVDLYYQFNSYTNRGHSVHEETETYLYADIIPKISDSFYVHILEPPAHEILGDSIVCNDQLQKDYSTLSGQAHYYDWEVIGGSILNNNIFNNNISVLWDPLLVEHKIKLTPYSIHGARGKTDSLEILMNPAATNSWVGNDGTWNQTAFWSLGHIPRVCEDVDFADQSEWIKIDISDGNPHMFRSIEMGEKVFIEQFEGTNLEMITGGAFILRGKYLLQGTYTIKHPLNHNTDEIDLQGDLIIGDNGTFVTNP